MSHLKKFPERYNGEIASFEGIEVGDKFLRRDGHYETTVKLVECSKITAKQCVIDGFTYRIADARELGRYHGTYRGHPMNYTDEAFAAGEKERRIRTCRRTLSGVRWEMIPEDRIEAVWGVVGDLLDKPKGAA